MSGQESRQVLIRKVVETLTVVTLGQQSLTVL